MSAPCPPHLQGSYEGLRAWGICQLVRLGAEEKKGGAKGKGKKGGSAEDDWEEAEGPKARGKKGGAGKARGGDRLAGLTVRRYYRPEDISLQQAYKAGSYYEVYASGGCSRYSWAHGAAVLSGAAALQFPVLVAAARTSWQTGLRRVPPWRAPPP